MVYHALNQDSEPVAIKAIDLISLKEQEKAFELFKTEVEFMKRIKNPNVVKFIDYYSDSK
jgi:serine/threonine protein kinase